MANNNQNNNNGSVNPFVKPGEDLGYVGPLKKRGLWPPKLHDPKNQGNRDQRITTPYLVIPAYTTDQGQRPQPNSIIFHSQGIWLEDEAGILTNSPQVGRAYTVKCNVINWGAYASYGGLANFYINTADVFAHAITTNSVLPALGHTGFSVLQGQLVTVTCPTVWRPASEAELASTIIVEAFDAFSDNLITPFDAANDRHVGRHDLSPDFYVRDWTVSETLHDTGSEPSGDNVFYTTSDVWNRRTNEPGPFINDTPQNEDPQAGDGSSGENFIFARISRNTAATEETVSAHFLFAEFGTGSPFTDCSTDSDPTLTFMPGETQKIVSMPWRLHPTSSTHLCIAVQIYNTADPYQQPGLSGYTPGWPTTDNMVLNDNNKAQRNMSVWNGVTGTGGIKYARVFNGATYIRDMTLVLDAGANHLNKVINPLISVPGTSKLQRFKPERKLKLKEMMPGETRWIQFSYDSITAQPGEILTFYFNELKDGIKVNGFAFNLVADRIENVLKNTISFQSSILYRMAVGMGSGSAKEALAYLQRLQYSKENIDEYIALLPQSLTLLQSSLIEISANFGGLKDIFGVEESISLLQSSIDQVPTAEALAAMNRILHQVDALQTTAIKSTGDETAILFTVRLQKDVYSISKLSGNVRFKKLITAADGFIDDYSASSSVQKYPAFVRSSLEYFRISVDLFNNAVIAARFNELEKALGLTVNEIQQAHLNFLNTLLLSVQHSKVKAGKRITGIELPYPLNLKKQDSGA